VTPRSTDRYTETRDRVGTPSRLTGPTYVRTDGLTEMASHLPETSSSSVTRTRTYGDLDEVIHVLARALGVGRTLTPRQELLKLNRRRDPAAQRRRRAELAASLPLCAFLGPPTACLKVAEDGPWCHSHAPDESAIQRAVNGDRVKLLPYERREVIRRMYAAGVGTRQIQERLGVSGQTLYKALREAA
jgi:hypothetical protein